VKFATPISVYCYQHTELMKVNGSRPWNQTIILSTQTSCNYAVTMIAPFHWHCTKQWWRKITGLY